MHRILSQLDVIKGGCLRGMMQYWGSAILPMTSSGVSDI